MLKIGDKVIVRDEPERGSLLFVGIVHLDDIGPFVYATPHVPLDLYEDDEGTLWCYGDDLNSPAARALEVASVLSS